MDLLQVCTGITFVFIHYKVIKLSLINVEPHLKSFICLKSSEVLVFFPEGYLEVSFLFFLLKQWDSQNIILMKLHVIQRQYTGYV